MASWKDALAAVMQLYPDLVGDVDDELSFEALIEIEQFRARMTLRQVFAPLLENVDPITNIEFETSLQSDDQADWQNYFDAYGADIMNRRLLDPQLRDDVFDVTRSNRINVDLLPNEKRMLDTAAHYASVINTKNAAEAAMQAALQELNLEN